MSEYRGFSIDILPRKGFAGRTWFFFRISGNGLRIPIESDTGEQTQALALDEAKEFVDEHLVA